MQKFNSLIVLACVACLLVVSAGLVGCSESGAKTAGKRLTAAVKAAQGRMDQSLLLMSSAGPAAKPSQVGAVLDPRAREVLSEAQADLSAAIAENSEADAGILALANQELGRIMAMQGQCYVAVSVQATENAHAMLNKLTQSIGQLQTQAGLAAYYEGLGSLDLSQMDSLLAGARREISRLQLDRRWAEAELERLKGVYNMIQAENRQLEIEARQVRQAVPESGGTEVLEQALAKEQKIVANAGEIAKLERGIFAAESSLQEVGLDLAAVEKKVDVVTQARESRTGEAARGARTREKMSESMAATKREISERLAGVLKFYRQADESAAEAIDAYEAAIRALDAARRQGKSRIILAAGAEARAAIGSIRTRKILLAQHGQRVSDALRQIFSKIQSPLPVGTERLSIPVSGDRDSAAESYAAAAQLYQQAARSGREGRWRYQLQQAAALIGKYRLMPDKQLLQSIKDLLEEVTDDIGQEELAVQHIKQILLGEALLSDPESRRLLMEAMGQTPEALEKTIEETVEEMVEAPGEGEPAEE